MISLIELQRDGWCESEIDLKSVEINDRINISLVMSSTRSPKAKLRMIWLLRETVAQAFPVCRNSWMCPKIAHICLHRQIIEKWAHSLIVWKWRETNLPCSRFPLSKLSCLFQIFRRATLARGIMSHSYSSPDLRQYVKTWEAISAGAEVVAAKWKRVNSSD